MLIVSIDGACRRNGKPDCTSSGASFAVNADMHEDGTVAMAANSITYCHEFMSTNQRGEMMALLCALRKVEECNEEAIIVTDSEYLFNTMSKGWYKSWRNNRWFTSTNAPVKNRDLWESIVEAYEKCLDKDLEITFYHVKGHVISVGLAGALKLFEEDEANTGNALLKAVADKYDESLATRSEYLEHAKSVCWRNNGFNPDAATLRRLVIVNTVADLLATIWINKVEAAH